MATRIRGVRYRINELAYRWRMDPAVLWIMAINVAVFVLSLLLRLFLPHSSEGKSVLFPLLSLPAYVPSLLDRTWTFFTYMFYHEDLWHILFNMLWFWFFSSLFLERYGSTQLVLVYLSSGIWGGALYFIAFNCIPYFEPILPYSAALGASASIMGITIMAGLTLPNRPVYLYGAIKMKVMTLVLIVVGIDLLSIMGSNAGGHIAHLGGAAQGALIYWLAERRRRKHTKVRAEGMAWGAVRRDGWRAVLRVDWMSIWRQFVWRFVDFWRKLQRLFSLRSTRKRVSNSASKYYSSGAPTDGGPRDQEQIGRVLEKLRRGGYGALTPEEKNLLFRDRLKPR